jgi:cytochrome b subunit of formate dehydrogenase
MLMRKAWKLLVRVVSAITIVEFVLLALFALFESAKFIFLPTVFTMWVMPFIHTHWPAQEKLIVAASIVLYAVFIVSGLILFIRLGIQKYRHWRARRSA